MDSAEYSAKCSLDNGSTWPYDAPDPWRRSRSKSSALPASDWAHFAARGVLFNLCDRQGISSELDRLDENIRKELVESIAAIIRLAPIEFMAKDEADCRRLTIKQHKFRGEDKEFFPYTVIPDSRSIIQLEAKNPEDALKEAEELRHDVRGTPIGNTGVIINGWPEHWFVKTLVKGVGNKG